MRGRSTDLRSSEYRRIDRLDLLGQDLLQVERWARRARGRRARARGGRVRRNDVKLLVLRDDEHHPSLSQEVTVELGMIRVRDGDVPEQDLANVPAVDLHAPARLE